MGRYYTGDIEGKFWFAVQDMMDASFFGGEASEARYINYYFGQKHLHSIKKGIKTCFKKLGKNKAKLDQFFALNNIYNDEMLIEAGFKKDEIPTLLKWYARLDLGEKILKYVKEHSSCSFKAEW
jgi:hypothetical protein